MKHFKTLILLINFSILMTYSSGCANKSPHQIRVIDTIIIKNSTNTYIDTVFVSKDFSLVTTKTGLISPVLANSEQVYGRPTRATRLPNTFQVKWITADKRTLIQEISIKDLLEQAPKNAEKTIVVNFDTQNHVNVYLLK